MSIRSLISIPLFASACLLTAPAFAQSVDNPADAEIQTSKSPSGRYIFLANAEENANSAPTETANTQADSQNEEVGLFAFGGSDASAGVTDVVTDPADNDEDKIVKGHGLQLGMTFLGVPDGIIDNWFEYHGSTWDDAVNMGFSLDYTLRFVRPCEMRFSLSWVNAKTGDAYWLNADHKNQHQLADYIQQNFSIIALEVAAFHIIPIVQNASALTELDFYYGGGLWGGVVLGSANRYAIRSSCARESSDITSCPHEPTSSEFLEMPRGFGFVTVTLGFKFTLVDILTIRAEGGFKGYLFGQLGLGVEF